MAGRRRGAVPQPVEQGTLAALALLGVAAGWGLSFPLTKQVVNAVSPTDLLAQRYTLAALVAALLLFRFARALSPVMVRRGIVLGVMYGLANIAQTEGLAHTSASASGFITGMYVVLTPVCGLLLLRTRILPRWWAGAGLATVGLAVMSLDGLAIGYGEAVTLVSALLYAVHIVGLGHWSTARDALGLSVVQLVATAAVSVLAALPGGIQLVSTTPDWLAVLYLAVVSGALALIAQSWAQAHLPATRAAVIMVTEPVWAAALSITFFGEPLGWRIAVGGVLMLIAMLVVELSPRGAGGPPHAEDLPRLAS